jgi:hypothetical protein
MRDGSIVSDRPTQAEKHAALNTGSSDF